MALHNNANCMRSALLFSCKIKFIGFLYRIVRKQVTGNLSKNKKTLQLRNNLLALVKNCTDSFSLKITMFIAIITIRQVE